MLDFMFSCVLISSKVFMNTFSEFLFQNKCNGNYMQIEICNKTFKKFEWIYCEFLFVLVAVVNNAEETFIQYIWFV